MACLIRRAFIGESFVLNVDKEGDDLASRPRKGGLRLLPRTIPHKPVLILPP
jgi:hypothetical protein